MSDSRLEWWGAACLLGVCLLLGCPVAVLQLTGERPTAGPWWVWWACYGGFLALLVCAFLVEKRAQRILVAGAVAAAASTVLLANEVGWMSILLVFVTAMVAELFGGRAAALLVVLNTGVAGGAVMLRDATMTNVAFTALLYAMLQVASVWTVLSERRHAETSERLAVANTELRAATELLAESSRSGERLRIARELHDLLGHQLTALVLELEVAAHRSEEPAKPHVERARGLARDLLGDVRTAVGELRERPVRFERALQEIVADLPRPRVHLDVADVEPDEACAAALIRCVQEVVTNSIRHANARNLWLEVVREGDGVVLNARDDGGGASVLRLGNGLTGIRERVGQLGGDVSFDTRSGFGMRVRVPS